MWLLTEPCRKPSVPQKVYGNNKVFFRGRFIAGPDVRSCAATALMILVPSVIWQAEVGLFLTRRCSIWLPVFVGVLQVASMALMLATAFSDPGIMPRQKDYTEQYDSKTLAFRDKQPPRLVDVLLRGHSVKLKYCTTCNIYRPPRCTHCSVCENCIERFDHHCPWIGNCIGKRNYWLFYTFVSFTCTLNVLVLVTSLAQLGVLAQEFTELNDQGFGDGFVTALQEEPLTAAVAVYSLGTAAFTVGLCGYHTYLVCANQTTYEQIRGAYAHTINPFSRGIVGNFQDIILSRVRPKYFNPFTGDLLWPSAGLDARAGSGTSRGGDRKGSARVGADSSPPAPRGSPQK